VLVADTRLFDLFLSRQLLIRRSGDVFFIAASVYITIGARLSYHLKMLSLGWVRPVRLKSRERFKDLRHCSR
jgi:hypothetical protein